MKRQVIILFGPPGAGKGTQAGLISDKLSLYHFETSKILEEKFSSSDSERYIEVAGRKYDVLNEKQIWLDGKLCSPPFVAHLVKEKIKRLYDNGQDIVFSGSPRTVFEAEELLPLIEELFGKENISVFYIKISAEQTIYRNSHRRICELMRHSVLFGKETEGLTLCPFDGSKLVKRGLDTPDTIKVRIKEFQERTLPVLSVLEKRGLSIKEIDGERTISEVFKDIFSKING